MRFKLLREQGRKTRKAVGMIRGSSRKAKIKKRLYDRAKGICTLCGLKMTYASANIDHKIPKFWGGKNGKGNYQITHSKCNSMKGHDMTGASLAKIREKAKRR